MKRKRRKASHLQEGAISSHTSNHSKKVVLQERLALSAVPHRVSTLHPHNERQHNRQHKAAHQSYRSPGQGHRA